METAYWQEHGQAVDPNLLRLADAYDTAMGKLGDAAADAWAPDAAAAAEDSDVHQETQHHAHGRSGSDQATSRDSSSGADCTLLHHRHIMPSLSSA